jgi:hypothetical protein
MITFRQFIEAAAAQTHTDLVDTARQRVLQAQQAQQRAVSVAAARKRLSDELTRIKGQAKASGKKSGVEH